MKELNELRRVAGGRNTIIGAEIYKLCDAIERELAERYMELPVDSDGVPIKPGDKLVTDYGSGEVYHDRVDYIMWDGKRWDFWHAGDDCPTFDVNDMSDFYSHVKHAKTRTIEDVLLDAGVSVAAVSDVAAELRELMGCDV